MRELPVSYGHTEWYLFFCSVKAINNCKLSAIKQILLIVIMRGRVDDLSFFDYLCPLYFLLIEFRCIFPFLIKFYQIMFIIIVFRLGCDGPSGLLLFVPAVLFFHTHASLLSVFVCLIVLLTFLLFPCVCVWENTRA